MPARERPVPRTAATEAYKLRMHSTQGMPTRELPMFALPPASPRSAISDIATRWKEPLAVELRERDANRCILVRRCEPVFVLLCDAEELLHLIRSWRCWRPVRIERPCELAEEAV
jgi:hypothetical protein